MCKAARRLIQEFKELSLHPTDCITAGPKNEDNILEWEAIILGPPDTPYEGGYFHCILKYPNDYPLNPPTLYFDPPIWHPNVHSDGKVCISILHPPGEDIWGYEQSCERWSPAQSTEKILISVMSMLAEPNPESPANIEAAKQFRTNKQEYNDRVLVDVKCSLGLN